MVEVQSDEGRAAFAIEVRMQVVARLLLGQWRLKLLVLTSMRRYGTTEQSAMVVGGHVSGWHEDRLATVENGTGDASNGG